MTVNTNSIEFKRLTFTQRVFRCLPDSEGRLLFHLIDDESRQHFFSLYSLHRDEFIANNFVPPYKFKPGIEAITSDMIYFHDYVSDDMPTHSGIIAYSIPNKKLMWSVDELVYQFHDDQGVYAAKELFESKQFFLLSQETGEIIEEFDQDFTRVNQLRRSLEEEESGGAIQYSQLISYDENNTLLTKFLPLLDPFTVVGEIEHLVTDANEYLGFYTKEINGEFTHHLIVMQTQNSVIEHIELENGMKGMMWESFFFYQGTLILTTGRNEISLLKERLL